MTTSSTQPEDTIKEQKPVVRAGCAIGMEKALRIQKLVDIGLYKSKAEFVNMAIEDKLAKCGTDGKLWKKIFGES